MIEEHETYLAREDAERITKLGFDWGNGRNSIFYDGSEECPGGVWAPRVSLALTWLFNKYNAVVTVDTWVHDLDPERNAYYTFKYIIRWDDGHGVICLDSHYDYHDPMTALAFGVKRCIKLIAEKHAQSTQER